MSASVRTSTIPRTGSHAAEPVDVPHAAACWYSGPRHRTGQKNRGAGSVSLARLKVTSQNQEICVALHEQIPFNGTAYSQLI